MKRRVEKTGADAKTLQKLHRRLVEHLLMGMDINPVSLQLAGAQFTLGDTGVRYQKMNLWRMPYGHANRDNQTDPAKAGTLELLIDERIVGKPQEEVQKDLLERTYRDERKAERIALREDEPRVQEGMVDDVVEMVRGRRTALMNPPFITRNKLGTKFEDDEKLAVRRRIDGAQGLLELGDPETKGICDKTTTRPLYVALGLKCMDGEKGVLGTVIPTVALLAPSGRRERQMLAKELHIRWVVTCHEPKNVNVSQRTQANESLVIGVRTRGGYEEPTRFVSLARLPRGAGEALECIEAVMEGKEPRDGYVREVNAERMRRGDWSAAGWCNNALDEAVEAMGTWPELRRFGEMEGVTMRAPGHGSYTTATGTGTRRPMLNSKGGEGQRRLEGQPDSQMRLTKARGETGAERRRHEEELWKKQKKEYGAYLLLCTGQNTQSGLVNAVASETPRVGMNWKPVQGVDQEAAKAFAVWMNSTLGRIQMMAVRGGDGLGYPRWRPKGLKEVRAPRLENRQTIQRLAETYDRTYREEVPRYDEGYTRIRREWDQAVVEAIGSASEAEVTEWARMLNEEPGICPEGFEQMQEI